MSNYSRNGIYNKVATAINNAHSTVFCTGTYTPTPKSLPCAMIREVSNTQPKENTTLAFDDSQYQSTFEVQVYSNKKNTASSEAHSIMETAKTAFKTMKFIRTMEEEIENADPTIFRLVARFQRTIGGSDTMPT